jgi:hypothetical protein
LSNAGAIDVPILTNRASRGAHNPAHMSCTGQSALLEIRILER